MTPHSQGWDGPLHSNIINPLHVCTYPSLRVEEGFSTLDASPLEEAAPSSNGCYGNNNKTEGFITALLLPLFSGLNLKCDLMGNNENSIAKADISQDRVCGILSTLRQLFCY